jgi:outer membrane protein assembly factor BamB
MKTKSIVRLFCFLLCTGLLSTSVTSVVLAQQPIGIPSPLAIQNTNSVKHSSQKTTTYSDAWPMYGHDAAHTGRSNANGPNSPDIKWTWSADGPVGSPVVGIDGSIYVTAYLGIYHEEVVALNPEGTVRWRIQTTDGQYAYPTIGIDGKVYVIFSPTDADDSLLALNPIDGTTAWSFNLGKSSLGIGYSTFGNNSRPLVGPDGTIYVASASGTAGYGTIFAINPNGTQKWSWDTSTDDLYCGGSTYLIYCAIESTPALAPNGTLYVKPYGQGVIALNSATGEYLWRNNFSPDAGGADPFGQSLSVGSDSVAHTSEGSGRYNFYAVNPDNTIKWVTATSA